MALDIAKYITFVRQIPEIGNSLGEALQQIESAVNQGATHAGVDATQILPAPPQIQRLRVKTDGQGGVHAVIDDSSNVQKGIHYFVEYSTDKKNWHVRPLGPSRTLHPFDLPGKDDNGKPQTFFFRAYSQYPGGHASKAVYFGDAAPTAVAPGGTRQMTLLASTGSGTSPNNGEIANVGFGRDLFRKL